MKKLLLSFVLLSFTLVVFAAKIETVSTYSKVMNKEIKAVVVTPDNYSTAKRLPVIYLLHDSRLLFRYLSSLFDLLPRFW